MYLTFDVCIYVCANLQWNICVLYTRMSPASRTAAIGRAANSKERRAFSVDTFSTSFSNMDPEEVDPEEVDAASAREDVVIDPSEEYIVCDLWLLLCTCVS